MRDIKRVIDARVTPRLSGVHRRYWTKFGRKNSWKIRLQQQTIIYGYATFSPINQTLAGVAQSVERVALINSKEINLKVVGSSPTFGYSYIKAH